MPRTKLSRIVPLALFACALVTLPAPPPAGAQASGCGCTGIEDFGYRLHHHDRPAPAVPTGVGQAALGAIQEVAGLLLSDPRTDWSQVSIARLRQHLVDLDEVVLHAEVDERPADGGLAIRIGGSARTLEAARRVVPAHARAVGGFRGWSVSLTDAGDVLELTLSAGNDPEEVAVLRGLGFFGFVATGVHRPHQLLSVARGLTTER